MLLALVLVLLGGLSAEAQQCFPEQLLKLLPADGAENDRFGGSVAISGTTVIVGAHRDDDNGEDSGAAYLFDTTTGQQIAKLLPTDGTSGDLFGSAVWISGTIAIVGAPRDDDNGEDSGSAYLFDTTTGQQIVKLLPDDGAAGDKFGGDSWGDRSSTVFISGTTAIVGAQRDDDNGEDSGSAYIFDTSSGSQIAKLLPDDGMAGDVFGNSVAMSGTMAIIGSRFNDHNGMDSGAAYLFDTTTGQQVAKLLPTDGETEDYFGWVVAISGTTAIVGAPKDWSRGERFGSAYLFDTTSGQQIAMLVPTDGETGDLFGWAVAINGTTAIVGAPRDNDNGMFSGSTYHFDTITGEQIGKFLADDGGEADRFGVSVAITGTIAVVGAYRDGDNGPESGSAYLFDVSCTEVVVPDSFLVTHGTYVAGGLAELAVSDNADLSLQRATADIQSRTEFEVKAVSPVASPTTMAVTLEGSVFARSQVNHTIELFDYFASQWEQVDTRPATRFTDSTVTVVVTGDLSRFVEAGTMCMNSRIRYQSLNPRQQFSSNTDQFLWTIGQ